MAAVGESQLMLYVIYYCFSWLLILFFSLCCGTVLCNNLPSLARTNTIIVCLLSSIEFFCIVALFITISIVSYVASASYPWSGYRKTSF